MINKYVIILNLNIFIFLAGNVSFAQDLFVNSDSEKELYSEINDQNSVKPTRYDFETFDDWQYSHQDTCTKMQYRIADGNLFLSTRAGTYDRTKARLKSVKLGVGKSSCRVFVPTMYAFDQTSIASFLYCDDKHELDFEIGYGKAEVRALHNAKENEVLCYMTSQGYPFQSEIVKLEMGHWYVIDIDITLKDGAYFVQWLIDGEVKATLQQTFGEEVKFTPVLSLENLKFLGDHIPKNNYEVEFDWLEIVSYEE